MKPWIGPISVAYLPTVPIADPRVTAPPNFKDVVTQRLVYDPDTNGVDRSLKAYLFAVSYGRASLAPTVYDPVTVTRALAMDDPGNTASDAIMSTLSGTAFQNACVVFPAYPPGRDYSFYDGPPLQGTNVSNYCYDFLSSRVGAWAMEVTHILTYFGDLYQTSDGDPWGFDNMACACGVHPSTFTKLKLGWLDPSEILDLPPSDPIDVTLHALCLPRPSPAGQFTAIRVPLDNPNHYFIIEARLKLDVFDQGIPSEGVVVYEIDESVWAPVHLRTSPALQVGQSYSSTEGFTVTVSQTVVGGLTVHMEFVSPLVSVPDVTDLTLSVAEQKVQAAGFQFAWSGPANGFVFIQNPQPYAWVRPGSTVRVVLRGGPRR